MLSTKNSLHQQKHRLKVNIQKKIFHANINQKRAEVAILILEKNRL